MMIWSGPEFNLTRATICELVIGGAEPPLYIPLRDDSIIACLDWAAQRRVVRDTKRESQDAKTSHIVEKVALKRLV